MSKGVFWPAEGDPLRPLVEGDKSSSNHRLVWIDIRLKCAPDPVRDYPSWVVEGQGIASASIVTSAGSPDAAYAIPAPANFGEIPQTLQATGRGGDGAPLDVVVLGASLRPGSVVGTRIVGLLRLVDGAARDEKILGVCLDDQRMSRIGSVQDLERELPGTLEILESWYSHKDLRPGQVRTAGRGDAGEAHRLVSRAHADFLARSRGEPPVEKAAGTSPVTSTVPASLQTVMPGRMLIGSPLTLKAELLDGDGRIAWQVWHALGTVRAVRVADGRDVPIRTTVFETVEEGAGGGLLPVNGIHFYNGIGSISFLLANGEAEAPGEIEISVSALGSTASMKVTLVSPATPGLFRRLEGTLSDKDLVWSREDGVVLLTGTVRVPAGRTLRIRPGTMIMADPGPAGEGTAILVEGSVDARGTAAEPIYFFPSSGPPAMALPQEQHNNPSSWRGLWHSGDGKSVYSNVILVGAGNGPTEYHPRPPVIRLVDGHSIELTDCTLVDSPGKMINGGGHGIYRLSRCLISRTGIGGEFYGEGHQLWIEDSWFTRIGRAPEARGTDGDMLHLDNATSRQTVRGCIFADGGDDAIDHSDAHPVIERLDHLRHSRQGRQPDQRGNLARQCPHLPREERDPRKCEHLGLDDPDRKPRGLPQFRPEEHHLATDDQLDVPAGSITHSWVCPAASAPGLATYRSTRSSPTWGRTTFV